MHSSGLILFGLIPLVRFPFGPVTFQSGSLSVRFLFGLILLVWFPFGLVPFWSGSLLVWFPFGPVLFWSGSLLVRFSFGLQRCHTLHFTICFLIRA